MIRQDELCDEPAMGIVDRRPIEGYGLPIAVDATKDALQLLNDLRFDLRPSAEGAELQLQGQWHTRRYEAGTQCWCIGDCRLFGI